MFVDREACLDFIGSSVSRKSLRQRSLCLSDILVAFGAFLAFHQVDYIASATV